MIPLAGPVAAVGVLAADQLSKAAAVRELSGAGPVDVLPILNLVLTHNTGVSFGLLGGGAVPPWILAGVAGAVTLGVLVWMLRTRSPLERLALGLVAGGALGNIADRIARGAVVDFLDFHAWGWHWPAFNLADSAIVLGVCMLLSAALPTRRRAPG